MSVIHEQIYKHFDANRWRLVGYDPHGVCVFEIYKDDEFKAKGTLLELGNEARKCNT